jgi:hypothetical protein
VLISQHKAHTKSEHSELLDFWTLSIIQYSKKLESTTFQKLDLFPFSGEGGRRAVGRPLETANLNHWPGLR